MKNQNVHILDIHSLSKRFIKHLNILEVKIWNRDVNGGQSVEDVLSGSNGPSQTIKLCQGKEVGQGESVAVRNDGKGFYTVSEAPGEDEAIIVNVPMYYYAMDTGYLITTQDVVM